MLTAASSSWMQIRNLRRSSVSASTPAGIASRNAGNDAAACTNATAVGEDERSVINQDLATSRTKLPTLPRTVAVQSTKNSFCFSGAKLLLGGAGVVGGMVGSVELIQRLQAIQQEQPRAPKKLLGSEAGTLEAQAFAWLWPCTPQLFAQPQAAAMLR